MTSNRLRTIRRFKTEGLGRSKLAPSLSQNFIRSYFSIPKCRCASAPLLCYLKPHLYHDEMICVIQGQNISHLIIF